MRAAVRITSNAAAFDTRHRDRDKKKLAVLNAAADLFLSRGYNFTRLDDIATSLGITKPALYNYFKNKQEILFACHRMGHDIIDEAIKGIEQRGGTGIEMLRFLIQVYAAIMTQKFGMCLVRLDDHELAAKDFAHIKRRRRFVYDRFETYIRKGIADGSIIECDVRMTAFWLAGAINNVTRWYKPGGMTSEEIGSFLARDTTRGLARHAEQADAAARPARRRAAASS